MARTDSWQQATRADGARVAYQARGDGPPLLLIPGLGQSSRLFGTLPRTLARLGWRAIAFDPVGLGRSAAAGAAPWSVEGAITDFESVLRAERVERAHLLATSMGGKLALLFAARAPERVAGAFLYGTDARFAGRARTVYEMFEVLFERTAPSDLARILRPLLFGRTFLDRYPAVVADVLRGFEPSEAERRTTLEQIRDVPRHDFAAILARVHAPVVCHAGAEDTLVEPADVEATANALPHGEFVAIERAGHSMLLENPELALAALRRA